MTKRSLNGILLLSLAVGPGCASTLFFEAAFATDTQVALFSITANTSETIAIQTDSYAGGAISSTGIPAGGFAPTALLFDNLGDVFDNNPLGRFVTDGFVQDGNPGFTCQEAGTSGTFCDVTTALRTTRTGNYAIAIIGADSVSTPSPAVSFCFSPAAV